MLKRHGEEMMQWLQRGCCVYVAGSAGNMPAAMREAFVNIVQFHGKHSASEAEQFVASMETRNLYQTETWS